MQAMAAKNVDEYISAFPPDVQKTLYKLRRTIKTAAPKAEEVISYEIPGYMYHGMLIFFAAWKDHISVYPAPRQHEAFKKELTAYKGGKGTVQFPLDKPIPFGLITKIIKFRIKANEENFVAKNKKALKPIAAKKKSTKPTDEDLVNAYIDKLEHAAKTEINAVRKIIRGASPKLNERIKWNAPSYYYKEDIVTFGPYKTHKLLLVFHHPTVVRIKSPLLQGDYKNRRLIYLENMKAIKDNKKELERIMQELVKAIDKK